MITEYTNKHLSNILNVINDAALKYKGVIPDDCWHEPYMLEQALTNEFDSGVRMFGYARTNTLVGVMGIQELRGVTLIRHAYTLTNYQGKGIGKSLLQYLVKINESSRLLAGTWQEASWAIRFYLKNGFVLHTRKQADQLLDRYWQVPLRQMETSVVLENKFEGPHWQTLENIRNHFKSSLWYIKVHMSRAAEKCTSWAEQNRTTERRNMSSKVCGV